MISQLFFGKMYEEISDSSHTLVQTTMWMSSYGDLKNFESVADQIGFMNIAFSRL